MKALLFGVEPAGGDEPFADAPMGLRDVAAPALPGPDWVLLRPTAAGVCGSDVKQAQLDADPDNPMVAVVSFPHVPGHEIVGEVVDAGPASGLRTGDRVAVDPWLPCAPRGIEPACAACRTGDRQLCTGFARGRFAAGMHLGVCADLPGGFAELVAAHRSMCVAVPAELDDDVAVLADPAAVALAAVERHPPPPGGRAVVHGVGTIGAATVAALAAARPDVAVLAVARFPHQADLAQRLGAARTSGHAPAEVIDAVADWTGAQPRSPLDGLPVLHGGGADVVYDTVGSAATLEVAVRVLRERGTCVLVGIGRPARFEWTPLYAKELRLVGSNAYGAGVLPRVVELLADGALPLAGAVTHRFALAEWRQAYAAAADHATSGATKVVITP